MNTPYVPGGNVPGPRHTNAPSADTTQDIPPVRVQEVNQHQVRHAIATAKDVLIIIWLLVVPIILAFGLTSIVHAIQQGSATSVSSYDPCDTPGYTGVCDPSLGD